MQTPSDSLQRFLFEQLPIRGELVHLDAAWQEVLHRHDYPPVLRGILGELCAAAVLLAATLKLRGALVLQVQGRGVLKLLVVECSGDLALRATAKWEGELTQGSLPELVGEGNFVITLDPEEGNRPYQGIVPLQGDSIAEMLENYMSRSEQLETRLWLAADDQQAAGLLLQRLPERDAAQQEEGWRRAGLLAATLRRDELLLLPPAQLLHRLYHEEDIRLFEPQPVRFRCTCSRENVANMLRMIGRGEVESILREREVIEVSCEFCHQSYRFDRAQAEAALTDLAAMPVSATRH
ncbi:MAG: Hsp33 family molecular chaperone HslO [Sideroxydans sp.]